MAFKDIRCLYCTAVPLIFLWSLQSEGSLNTCTVQLYVYSQYGTYGMYRPSAPVQYNQISTTTIGRMVCTDFQFLYSTAIPLLPLRSRTACTVPHCMYCKAKPSFPPCSVHPLQCFSACTVQLNFYTSFRPYGLHTASDLLEYSKISTHPFARNRLCRASVPLENNFSSNSFMGRTFLQCLSACTVVL